MTKTTLITAVILVNMAFFTLTMATKHTSYATISSLKSEAQEYEKTIDIMSDMLFPDPKKYPFPISEGDIRITSQYGVRISPVNYRMREHDGLDIYSYAPRARVQSIADGVVVDAWPPPGGGYRGHPTYGGMVEIKHTDGSSAMYAHLSAKFVKQGQHVEAGEVIGREGQTGSATGEHLHFELRIEGILVNPYLWVAIPPTEELK